MKDIKERMKPKLQLIGFRKHIHDLLDTVDIRAGCVKLEDGTVLLLVPTLTPKKGTRFV